MFGKVPSLGNRGNVGLRTSLITEKYFRRITDRAYSELIVQLSMWSKYLEYIERC